MSGITLAVPSTGRLEELTREWFAGKGRKVLRQTRLYARF